MSEKTPTPDQRLNELFEQERVIIKKMNTAIRAGANPMVLSQFESMLTECRIQQQELRMIQSSSGDSDFDNFLSIG